MKGIEEGSTVTVKTYRHGKNVLHNLHGVVRKVYRLSALVVVDKDCFKSVAKLVGNDRIIVSLHEIAELHLPAIDLHDVKGAIISSWREGLTTPEIAIRVDKSIRTVYCTLKKLGLKPNRKRQNPQWIFEKDENKHE